MSYCMLTYADEIALMEGLGLRSNSRKPAASVVELGHGVWHDCQLEENCKHAMYEYL